MLLVGTDGLEPSTSSLSVKCSSQLSYVPSSNSQVCTYKDLFLLRAPAGGTVKCSQPERLRSFSRAGNHLLVRRNPPTGGRRQKLAAPKCETNYTKLEFMCKPRPDWHLDGKPQGLPSDYLIG